MQDAMLSFRDAELADAPLALRLLGDRGTFTFDTAEYDEADDRLRLTAGPPVAEWRELTPEGHVLCVSAPDGLLSALVLTDVRRRLVSDGYIEVTLGPGQRAVLDAGDVAHLLTSRPRTGRFVRR